MILILSEIEFAFPPSYFGKSKILSVRYSHPALTAISSLLRSSETQAMRRFSQSCNKPHSSFKSVTATAIRLNNREQYVVLALLTPTGVFALTFCDPVQCRERGQKWTRSQRNAGRIQPFTSKGKRFQSSGTNSVAIRGRRDSSQRS
jgi:hypothetical protein